MTPNCLVFLLLAFFLPLFNAFPVIITKFNSSHPIITQETIRSYYTTIGVLPSFTHHSYPVYFSPFNFSNDCGFSPSTNISLLEGSIIIITSFPRWSECVSEPTGVITAVARLMQKAGAIGAITKQLEQVLIISLFYIYA